MSERESLIRPNALEDRTGISVGPGGYVPWRSHADGREFCKQGHETDGSRCYQCEDDLQEASHA